MRAKLSVPLTAVLLCLTIAPVSYAANADVTFAKANADYAARHFREAIAGYESLARAQQWSASLFYDLGNAYFRVGDLGRAILNYERALALDPSQPEAQANLRLVRDQARALELAKSWPEEHLAFLTANQYAWLAASAFWCGAFIVCGFYFARRRPVVWIFALLLLSTICIGSLFAVYAFENGAAGRDVAIVTGQNIQARLATAENTGTVLVLPPGSEIKILSTRGEWTYAALPNELRGWIPTRSAESVRL
jgi:tetratricopeptide (TPR) repeat protein